MDKDWFGKEDETKERKKEKKETSKRRKEEIKANKIDRKRKRGKKKEKKKGTGCQLRDSSLGGTALGLATQRIFWACPLPQPIVPIYFSK